MPQHHPSVFFDSERAAAYDTTFEKLAPFRDTLQLIVRMAFRSAPETARALIVGAGTGAELLTLAEAFPDWRFTIVEPAPAMLEICRRRAEEQGVADRCVFHEGFVETLAPTPRHDVATALLVSQFILDRAERRGFFEAIAGRLVEHGLLAVADLATDGAAGDPADDGLMALWGEAMRFNGMSEESWRGYLDAVASHVAILSPPEIEALIADAGFDAPVRAYQAVLMHGWIARKTRAR